MLGWILGGILTVVLLVATLWWMNRPIVYRVKADDFERFIDQFVQLEASCSCLHIRERSSLRQLTLTVYRTQTGRTTLKFQLERQVWPDEVTDNILALCYDMDLGDRVDVPQTNRAERLLSVRIPQGSPARAAELSRGAFAAVGCSVDTDYDLWVEGMVDPAHLEERHSGGGAA